MSDKKLKQLKEEELSKVSGGTTLTYEEKRAKAKKIKEMRLEIAERVKKEKESK